MRIALSSSGAALVRRVSILLVVLAIVLAVTACEPVEYTLSISSTEGGSVATLGEGDHTYGRGTVVALEAEVEEGYGFVEWTGDVETIADVDAASSSITMNGDYSITANFAEIQEIWDWYDLDAIRDNLGGYHVLMNDVDSTTAGYEELAGPEANEGKGWKPMGTHDDPFVGIFDGQGHKIGDLFVDRPEEEYVGLFAAVGEAGVIASVGVVNAAVSGGLGVGGLVGENRGAVRDCYSSGNVTGGLGVGGLVGGNAGTVTNSSSAASVTGVLGVGGLVGMNYEGTVSACYSTGSVSGDLWATGGLVGVNGGTVVNSYSSGSVAGDQFAGGLVGHNGGNVRNCYSSGNVTGEADAGGLVGADDDGVVSSSFWDMEASGMVESDGGTGKPTAQMMDIATFTDTETEELDEPWDMGAVADADQRNPTYIWNIVDGQHYPFLSWQSV